MSVSLSSSLSLSLSLYLCSLMINELLSSWAFGICLVIPVCEASEQCYCWLPLKWWHDVSFSSLLQIKGVYLNLIYSNFHLQTRPILPWKFSCQWYVTLVFIFCNLASFIQWDEASRNGKNESRKGKVQLLIYSLVFYKWVIHISSSFSTQSHRSNWSCFNLRIARLI